MDATFKNWYRLHKRNKYRHIVDTTNFAVGYTPTSVEVGEGITAKFAFVDFASSRVGRSCMSTRQLIVASHSYGILLMVTVLRYSRYSSQIQVQPAQ